MNQGKPTHISSSGEGITEEVAQRLADEAEAGYELGEGTVVHIGRGRPSLSGDSSSPQVTFRVPSQLRAKADQRAAREGRTVSEIARDALERYLAA